MMTAEAVGRIGRLGIRVFDFIGFRWMAVPLVCP